jgi:hypothetical protein
MQDRARSTTKQCLTKDLQWQKGGFRRKHFMALLMALSWRTLVILAAEVSRSAHKVEW